jgi:hypothetical protein
LIPFLDRGHYLGLDANETLVRRGIEQELSEGIVREKKPEFVFSDRFEFTRFSRVPTVAIAVSLFTHLTAADIAVCLGNLRAWTGSRSVLHATYFEVARPVRNYRRSHTHLGFHYTRREIQSLGEHSGWCCEPADDWRDDIGHQKMMCFSPAEARGTRL